MISKAMKGFDWDKEFLNNRTDEKTSILTNTVLNIASDFIPNDIVVSATEIHPELMIQSNS